MSTPERLELVNLLLRLARSVETQNPEVSLEYAYIRHLAQLVASPGPTGTDWDAAAVDAMRFEEPLVARVPPQRSGPRVAPAMVTRGPRTPWAAESA